MKIAYVCADPGVPVYGSKGCSIHLREIVRQMTANGDEVTLFARSLAGERPHDFSCSHIVPLPPLPRVEAPQREQYALQSQDEIEQLLRLQGPFDMVYERYSLWNAAGMEYACKQAIPGILEVNAPLIEEQAAYRTLVDRRSAEHIAQRVFAASSALIAVSHGVADYLAGFANTKGKIHVVPNGVNIHRIAPWSPPLIPAADKITLGFLGGLKPWHGVDILIEAFCQLHKENLNVRLLIVGDGPERARLNAMAASCPEADIVFTGAVDAAMVPGFLTAMNIGVAPYPTLKQFYFSPLKIYEYMAAGLPVVASRTGDIPSIVEDLHTGLLVEPGSILSLTQALKTLVYNSAMRREMGARARKAASDGHSWESVISRIYSIAALYDIQEKSA